MPFSNVDLQPDQFALVRRVFEKIVGEPWFDRSRENESAFASMIVRESERGTTDESALTKCCKAIAEGRFSANTADRGDVAESN